MSTLQVLDLRKHELRVSLVHTAKTYGKAFPTQQAHSPH